MADTSDQEITRVDFEDDTFLYSVTLTRDTNISVKDAEYFIIACNKSDAIKVAMDVCNEEDVTYISVNLLTPIDEIHHSSNIPK